VALLSQDVVVGKIYFLLVRIKIKHMEVEIRRRESTGTGANTYNESETIAKYEIMDGAPVRGESIPIRLFLSPYDLTPTYRNINNKFSVKYFLNLVLVDEEDRRYFKQQEARAVLRCAVCLCVCASRLCVCARGWLCIAV
jgi:vacuolar protein sorting-associated protein 26